MLCEITPVSKFISFFYGVLDNQEHRLTYCNAGHNPPIVVRGGRDVVELNAAGAVLGQFPDWNYEQSEVHLRHGDSLFMFTDGLVEASGEDDEPIGEWGVVNIAKQNSLGSAADLLNQVMQKASEHCTGTFQDDATLLVLRAV
jgi:phosphoserine phosphatase RsbU/P